MTMRNYFQDVVNSEMILMSQFECYSGRIVFGRYWDYV